METKKGIFQTQHSSIFSQNKETSEVETYLKHAHPQNAPNDRLDRNLQYGLKISNEQNPNPNPNHQIRSDAEYRIVKTPEKFNNVTPSPHPYNSHYVQYQKTFQSPHYHPAQVPPASNLSHNVVVQNTPQIWVPQQPHYHHPPQVQKAEYKNINVTSAQQTTARTKDSEKKKSSGTPQLKSPVAKRPLEAPVTMQGWIHKQGSEGLMLWKKRWFVLSEYCLFYYKGPEEEKLLGSILLPSYKVSICKPEEKISKKYAFKCEHANMRTYILAADSQELMKQWIQALNLATMMQTNVEPQKPIQQKTTENYDPAGQHYYKTPFRLTPTTHTHSPSSSILQDQCSFNQPLYANAPPKPRRLNDGFSSPSPDILDRHNPHYMDPRTMDKSPVATYSAVNYNSKTSRESLFVPGGEFQVNHDFERRTPDTYGRSKLNHPHPTDYEDVYAEQQAIYKRPLSPVAYSHVIKRNNPAPINPAHRYYTPVNMAGPTDVAQYPAPQMRKIPSINIARPHSADFLEYELNHKMQDTSALLKQRPRPKSSLEINANTNENDNYFYSKERYAEKMRKSAQYLQNVPPKFRNEVIYNTNEPVRCPAHENTFHFVDRPHHVHTHHMPNLKLQVNNVQKPQPVRSKSVLSEGSLSKEIVMDMDPRLLLERESLSPDYMYGISYRNQEYDPFTRSASARLAAQTPSQVDRSSIESRSVHRDGDRKREESMRRLLEWKQRMLQSPLNRKIQGNIAYRSKNDFYSNNNHETGYKLRKNQKHSDVYLDDSRSKNSNQYNSYSSDDEENVERSKDDIVQSQAGGISDTGRPTPAQSTSTTTLITSADLAKPTCHSNLHDTPYTNVFEKLLASSFNQDDFPKHFKKFTKQDLQHIANFQSEYSHKLDQTSPNPDVKLNVQGKSEDTVEQEQSVLEENYIPMSPSKSVLSPRTSCNSGSDIFLDKSKIDENHYVEMTQNVSGCLLDSSFSTDRSDHQPYELVIFSEDKIEPLYMELKSPAEKVKSEDVPDILATPQKGTGTSKSDSSDADDEASKDLDSLDTPSQPRFSLSDTFRPASYYLGTTQVNTELQDSSDSELVSPPPIPPSPPPLDDLNGGEYVQLKVKDDESAEANMSTTSSPTINKYLKKKSARIKLLDGKSASPLLKGSDEVTAKFLNSDTDDDTAPRLTPINYVQLIKRRPASKDICVGGEIASPSPNASDASVLSAKNQQSVCNYRDELGINSTQLDFHEYENLIMSRYEGACTPKILSRSEDDSARSFSGLELQHIGRPESSTSTSAEINSFLQNSNRSTPILEAASVYTSNTFSPATAPYYYSDLSINITGSQSPLSTLNNQRSTTKCNKRDISHIKNPIRCNLRDASEDNTFKLAAEARSVSVDFLNLTDKSGHIDDKNIYESDTLQRNKSEHASRNLLATRKNDKFTSAETVSGDTTRVRRSHSLEGLLENVLKDGTVNDASEEKDDSTKTPRENASEGSYLWEEDAIWRERLRSASQRHTKSMEDLDTIGDVKKKSKSKSPRGITRSVTYVNDGFIKLDKQKEHEVLNAKSADNNKVKKEGSFILDREKLRQWDLMSSAPSDNQMTTTAVAGQLQDGNNIVVEITDANCDSAEMTGNQNAASGSISINTRDAAQLATRDTFPRVMSAKKAWISSNLPLESRSVTNLSRNFDKDAYSTPPSKMYYSNQASSHPNLTPAARQENWPSNEKVSVSAGELLGRTHEELVLLLIQLRRQSAQTLQAIENYYNEIDMIQAQLYAMDQARRMENLQKLEQIKQHLLELEKQYEKGKPLVNLVDNMVKLGSLYRAPQDKSSGSPHIRDRLEFNQQIQERRLLAEERREWNRLNSNHFQFQEKVQQLYMLDRLIHEESGTLQNLQQDKEDIERALGGLRHRLSKGFKDPSEVEMARKQQIMLENELSRVHYMLAQNSKKLEETVSGNARLEQELMVLKQKLQNSRQQSSPQYSNAGDSLTCTIGNNTGVESDLQKVEKKIGELQKQRQKLSLQVRQLTDRSPNTSQPKSPSNDAQNSFNKKKIPSLWRETDLDTMSIVDHGEYDYDNNTNAVKPTPLYINSDAKLEDYDYYNHSDSSNALTSESNLVMPQEKQEIKTVRIVKRESEKRQRDREKLIPPGKWDAVQEEENSSEGCSIFKPTPKMQGNSNVSNVSDDAHNPISSPYVCGFVEPQPHTSAEKSPDISPVFKSEAARQIITEMAVQNPNPTAKQPNRRAVPKEKRRHYTAPHNHLIIKSLNQLPNDIDTFDKISVNSRRARDDLDMERALRQRIDAPDVVRSTLINTELKYNERTIDDLLGTPSKINIPERYIPEQLPQLSVEEQEYRLKKVETIKKMLSDTTLISTSSNNLSGENPESQKSPSGTTASKATANILDEKKQREHLLQLNQILAKQVMEMSKIVAVNATAKLANQVDQINAEEEDLSPLTPLPLYQQRDNFYS